jgi:hypothetical protein
MLISTTIVSLKLKPKTADHAPGVFHICCCTHTSPPSPHARDCTHRSPPSLPHARDTCTAVLAAHQRPPSPRRRRCCNTHETSTAIAAAAAAPAEVLHRRRTFETSTRRSPPSMSLPHTRPPWPPLPHTGVLHLHAATHTWPPRPPLPHTQASSTPTPLPHADVRHLHGRRCRNNRLLWTNCDLLCGNDQVRYCPSFTFKKISSSLLHHQGIQL